MTGEPREVRDFAVVGTDTGVGKTLVTAGLVGRLRDAGHDARAIKPVQTGHPPDDDAAFVAEACGTDAAATCGPRLGPALAPEVAAEVADRTLAYAGVRERCATALGRAAPGVVEGVGGLRVPLADGREVVDLVADLDLPAVLVARSGLGTLNHTALSVEALRRRSVPVSGILLNRYGGASAAERTNPSVLEGMTDCPVHTLPPVPAVDPATAAAAIRDHLPEGVVPER